MIDAVCFDLDGTLVDSRDGIEWALRQAIADVLGPTDLRDIGSLIGARIDSLLESLIPNASPTQRKQVVSAFRGHYDDMGWAQTTIFPGVDTALERLVSQGIEMHIVTNKPSRPTEQVLSLIGIADHFARVYSPDTPPGFPAKTDALVHLLESEGHEAKRVLYVGDTAEDHETALAAGTGFLGVGYGYGSDALQESGSCAVATPNDLAEELARRLSN